MVVSRFWLECGKDNGVGRTCWSYCSTRNENRKVVGLELPQGGQVLEIGQHGGVLPVVLDQVSRRLGRKVVDLEMVHIEGAFRRDEVDKEWACLKRIVSQFLYALKLTVLM